jgi:hypothetical protein
MVSALVGAMNAAVQPTVAAAHKLAEEIAAPQSGRSFDHGVIEFRRLLATVPDANPSDMTAADIDTLGELAEVVIQEIESRLEEHNDRKAIQSDLAKAVYEIRLSLEAMDRWRRHFLTR